MADSHVAVRAVATVFRRGRLDLWVALVIGCLALAGCRPRAGPATPAELVRGGWEDYRLGEFARATRRFQAARAAAPVGSVDLSTALEEQFDNSHLAVPSREMQRCSTDGSSCGDVNALSQ